PLQHHISIRHQEMISFCHGQMAIGRFFIFLLFRDRLVLIHYAIASSSHTETPRGCPSPKETTLPDPLWIEGGWFLLPGDVLLSQGLSPQVPSALEGLTSVFGMGTGGSPPPSSPDPISFRVAP